MLRKLPDQDNLKRNEFRVNLKGEEARALEDWTGADGMLIAWELAVRDTFQMRPARGWSAGRKARAVPTLLRQIFWGPPSGAGARMWRVLKELKGLGNVGQPDLERDGVALEPGEVLKEAKKRWGEFYRRSRGRGGLGAGRMSGAGRCS